MNESTGLLILFLIAFITGFGSGALAVIGFTGGG